ncbi:hypothetical protein LCGC14_2650240 [marine sediment metagenome]|uniref:PilZ domain-containing protein n=1 Tax=marine sediment metagenome TaxID=412755 RepID=A0A0F8ZUX4_9ZZZZ
MSQTDNRRYERIPFSTDLTIVDLATQLEYEGHSINLSLGGISFYAERFFDTGSRIMICARADRSGAGPVTSISATVQWCRIEGDGTIMGAEFDQSLSRSFHPELCERLCSA